MTTPMFSVNRSLELFFFLSSITIGLDELNLDFILRMVVQRFRMVPRYTESSEPLCNNTGTPPKIRNMSVFEDWHNIAV